MGPFQYNKSERGITKYGVSLRRAEGDEETVKAGEYSCKTETSRSNIVRYYGHEY